MDISRSLKLRDKALSRIYDVYGSAKSYYSTSAQLFEVEEFSKWMQCDCYGYIIKEDDVEIDSCWGFIGFDYCIEAAKEAGAEKIEEVDA
jgi:hypothetical protein